MATNKSYTLVDKVVTATESGSSVLLSPGDKRWVVTRTVGAITGTSPTLDITIQHSADGTNWATLIALTQIVAGSASTTTQTFAASATDYLRPVLPYLRATYTIGGTSTPTFNGLVVKVLFDS